MMNVVQKTANAVHNTDHRWYVFDAICLYIYMPAIDRSLFLIAGTITPK